MSDTTIWGIIVGLAGLTFLIRYSFLGLLGGRVLPGWLTTALGFVPVAVLPALAAPLVLGGAEGAGPPLAFVMAGAATLVVGMLTRSLIGAFLTGMVAYHAVQLAGL